MMKAPYSKAIANAMLWIFIFASLPLMSQEKVKPVTLKGFVYWAEKKVRNQQTELTLTSIRDAVVMLRSTTDKKEFKSNPTPADGSYSFADLPPGTYIPGIVKDNKTYNLDGYVRIDPGENPIISFYLEKDRKHPALLPIKQGFFATPWGLATLAAGTAAAGIIIYNLVKPNEEEVSATTR